MLPKYFLTLNTNFILIEEPLDRFVSAQKSRISTLGLDRRQALTQPPRGPISCQVSKSVSILLLPADYWYSTTLLKFSPMSILRMITWTPECHSAPRHIIDIAGSVCAVGSYAISRVPLVTNADRPVLLAPAMTRRNHLDG